MNPILQINPLVSLSCISEWCLTLTWWNTGIAYASRPTNIFSRSAGYLSLNFMMKITSEQQVSGVPPPVGTHPVSNSPTPDLVQCGSNDTTRRNLKSDPPEYWWRTEENLFYSLRPKRNLIQLLSKSRSKNRTISILTKIKFVDVWKYSVHLTSTFNLVSFIM